MPTLTFEILVILLLISYLPVTIGELVPKRIALSNPERFAALIPGSATIRPGSFPRPQRAGAVSSDGNAYRDRHRRARRG
jgi:hypothetical protein